MKPITNAILITNLSDLKSILEEVAVKVQVPNKWVNVHEAARLLGVSTSTINQMRYNRQITYTQTSERVFMYERKSIEEILERYKQVAINKTDY